MITLHDKQLSIKQVKLGRQNALVFSIDIVDVS